MLIEDRLEVTFAFDAELSDPLASWLIGHTESHDRVHALAFQLVGPGDSVLDLGAHVGTFALPVAALGCRVFAIEAAPANVALLEAAVRRNGLEDRVVVLQAAVAAAAGTVRFTPDGPRGQAGIPRAGGEPEIEVRAVTVDEILDECSWGTVDLVKIDVEGSEPKALAGMSELLGRPDAPPILIESNGHTLAHYGASTQELRAALELHGYRCHLIDTSILHRLVPVSADEVQPECVADYLAFKETPADLAPWFVGAPFGHAELVERVLTMCRLPDVDHRAYAARVLRDAPVWMRAHPAILAAVEDLRADRATAVRVVAASIEQLD